MERVSRQDLEKQLLERGDGGRGVLGGSCNVDEVTDVRNMAWTCETKEKKV